MSVNSSSYIIEPIKNGKGLQFIYKSSSNILMITLIPLTILFVFLLDAPSPLAIGILFFVVISTFYITKLLEDQILMFDTEKNAFYILSKKTKEITEFTPFSKIDSIQVLEYEEYSRDEDDYTTYSTTYELNLLGRNRKIHIESNSNYKDIQKNARRLARVMDKPILNDKDRNF